MAQDHNDHGPDFASLPCENDCANPVQPRLRALWPSGNLIHIFMAHVSVLTIIFLFDKIALCEMGMQPLTALPALPRIELSCARPMQI